MLGELAYKQNLSDAVLDGKALSSEDRDYKTFVQRLSELMGESAGSTAKPAVPLSHEGGVASGATELVTPPKKDGDSDDFVLARWPDRMVSVMRHRKRGSVLAVARSREDVLVIRAGVRDHTPDATDVTVIDVETAELLQRLQQQGLVQLSPELESSLGESISALPPKTVINLDRAREHWKTSDRARKAAGALLGADLGDMARPHVETVLRAGLESLLILQGSPMDDLVKIPCDEETYGPHAAFAQTLCEWLRSEDGSGSINVSEMTNRFNQIDSILAG